MPVNNYGSRREFPLYVACYVALVAEKIERGPQRMEDVAIDAIEVDVMSRNGGRFRAENENRFTGRFQLALIIGEDLTGKTHAAGVVGHTQDFALEHISLESHQVLYQAVNR